MVGLLGCSLAGSLALLAGLLACDGGRRMEVDPFDRIINTSLATCIASASVLLIVVDSPVLRWMPVALCWMPAALSWMPAAMPWMNYTQSNKVNPMGFCVWDRRAVFWLVWVWRVWV